MTRQDVRPQTTYEGRSNYTGKPVRRRVVAIGDGLVLYEVNGCRFPMDLDRFARWAERTVHAIETDDPPKPSADLIPMRTRKGR